MSNFVFRRSFGLVIIPYRTFQHLLTPVDQARALTAIRNHLESDALLILNTFNPLQEMVQSGWSTGLRKDTDFIDPATGSRVVVWYSRDYDPQSQLMETETVFEELDHNGVSVGRICRRLTLHYFTAAEMEHQLERCGFTLEALYGNFQGSAYRGFGEQVWIARAS